MTRVLSRLDMRPIKTRERVGVSDPYICLCRKIRQAYHTHKHTCITSYINFLFSFHLAFNFPFISAPYSFFLFFLIFKKYFYYLFRISFSFLTRKETIFLCVIFICFFLHSLNIKKYNGYATGPFGDQFRAFLFKCRLSKKERKFHFYSRQAKNIQYDVGKIKGRKQYPDFPLFLSL